MTLIFTLIPTTSIIIMMIIIIVIIIIIIIMIYVEHINGSVAAKES